MSIPVINTTQSVLGFYQNEFFMFQPWATNVPTMWTSSPLPMGVSMDSSSGLIQGQAFFPGVYVFSLYAANADGTSGPAIFTIGIEQGSRGDDSDVELNIDVESGVVSIAGSNSTTSGQSSTTAGAPLFAAKNKDDLVLSIQFQKRGVNLTTLDLASLTLGLKENETDPSDLVLSTAFAGVVLGKYRLYAQLASINLTNALYDYEDDQFPGTLFNALAEINWVENVSAPPTGFPTTQRRGSETFLVELVRNIIP